MLFFSSLPLTERLGRKQTHLYISSLKNSRPDWQVRQAEQAIRRFDFFLCQKFTDNH